MKKQTKKLPTPTLNATIKDAFKQWMNAGVGRGELGKQLDLSVGELGRAFRKLNPDKTWAELKKLHDQKSKGRKPASKEVLRRKAA